MCPNWPRSCNYRESQKLPADIHLQYPSGFQYSVFNADYRGYAALDANVTGTQQSTYYFSGRMYFPMPDWIASALMSCSTSYLAYC